jgi:microcystin degradation protein MlrC
MEGVEPENRAVTVVKAALAVPTFAALAAASIAVHTSITAAVVAYNLLWRRRQQRLQLLQRQAETASYWVH